MATSPRFLGDVPWASSGKPGGAVCPTVAAEHYLTAWPFILLRAEERLAADQNLVDPPVSVRTRGVALQFAGDI